MKLEEDNCQELTDIPILGVYILVHKEEVVYIGSSVNVWERVGHHKKILEGYRENSVVEEKVFDKIYALFCDDEDDLEDLEIALWLKYKPKYNKQIPRRGARRGSRQGNPKDLEAIINKIKR